MTSKSDALCIYCGTARARTVTTCPTCGRGWIDERIGGQPAPSELEMPIEEDEAGRDLGIPASAAEAEAWITAELDVAEPARRRWAPLLAGAVAVAIVVLVAVTGAQILSGDDDGADDATATLTTTTVPITTTTTLAPTTTTAPATTTTTTTTTTTRPPVVIEAIGEPIPVPDLGLGAFALGPLDFGEAAADVLGRLVAGFGQPDEVVEIAGDLGLCADGTGRAARWGPFTVVTSFDDEGAETFVGYRLELGEEHPATGLTTLSGLRVGDTVADLQNVYAGLTIDLTEDDGRTVFVLTRPSDGTILLWGPVSSPTDDGTILGIYSPNSCDGGAGS